MSSTCAGSGSSFARSGAGAAEEMKGNEVVRMREDGRASAAASILPLFVPLSTSFSQADLVLSLFICFDTFLGLPSTQISAGTISISLSETTLVLHRVFPVIFIPSLSPLSARSSLFPQPHPRFLPFLPSLFLSFFIQISTLPSLLSSYSLSPFFFLIPFAMRSRVACCQL